jgi:uracil-DNA glycosylase
MPELPEIRRFAALISTTAQQSQLMSAHADLGSTQSGLPVRAQSRGKQLLLTVGERSLLLGFGLVGHWTTAADTSGADVRLWMRFQNGTVLVLKDAMKMAKWAPAADFDRKRGPDPIDEHAAFVENVTAAVSQRRLTGEISAALLNQQFFNGVGNYLRAELLHRAGIYPLDAIELVAEKRPREFATLLRLCRDVPLEIISLGINKYGDEIEKQRFADWLHVYDKGVFVVDSSKRKIYMHTDAATRFKIVDTATTAEPTALLTAEQVASLLLLVRSLTAERQLTDQDSRILKRSLLTHDASSSVVLGAWRAVLDTFDVSRDRPDLIDSLQQISRMQAITTTTTTTTITTTTTTTNSFLSDLLKTTNESWWLALQHEFSEPYMAALEGKLLAEEAAGHEVLPARNDIFNAFRLPLDDVRVVILGQDPYPTKGHAMGLAFSVHESVQPLPGSLQNIFTELKDSGFHVQAQTGDLSPWVQKGVLLLNATLTVRAGAANSHADFGWQRFTDQVIRTLCTHGRRDLVFLLWGKFAQEKSRLIVDRPIVACAHPSPLSARAGFFGSRCFHKVNEALGPENQVDWSI